MERQVEMRRTKRKNYKKFNAGMTKDMVMKRNKKKKRRIKIKRLKRTMDINVKIKREKKENGTSTMDTKFTMIIQKKI